jgi:hypothetical protein
VWACAFGRPTHSVDVSAREPSLADILAGNYPDEDEK